MQAQQPFASPLLGLGEIMGPRDVSPRCLGQLGQCDIRRIVWIVWVVWFVWIMSRLVGLMCRGASSSSWPTTVIQLPAVAGFLGWDSVVRDKAVDKSQ